MTTLPNVLNGETPVPKRPQKARILRPQDTCLAMLKANKPSMSFNAKTKAQCKAWQRKFKQAILRELRPLPDKAPLRPKVLMARQMPAYRAEKVIFDSDAFSSVPAWVLAPNTATPENPAPGVLCLHGHGIGKDALVGFDDEGGEISDCQKKFARQFALRGYVTISIDFRGFGERKDTDEWVRRPGRDGCNVAYLAAGYFGYHLLALQIWDGMRTLDYLQTRPEVDAQRIGCLGVSFGGTMTTYLTALDDRIRVAMIGCYLSSIGEALARANFCGAQYMPGLLKYGEISDVASLIAPRPLLVEVGERDECFKLSDALRAHKRLKRAYKAAGVPGRLALDCFPGGHEFNGGKVFDWFDRWLDHDPLSDPTAASRRGS